MSSEMDSLQPWGSLSHSVSRKEVSPPQHVEEGGVHGILLLNPRRPGMPLQWFQCVHKGKGRVSDGWLVWSWEMMPRRSSQQAGYTEPPGEEEAISQTLYSGWKEDRFRKLEARVSFLLLTHSFSLNKHSWIISYVPGTELDAKIQIQIRHSSQA